LLYFQASYTLAGEIAALETSQQEFLSTDDSCNLLSMLQMQKFNWSRARAQPGMGLFG